MFDIDKWTGELRLKGALDREKVGKERERERNEERAREAEKSDQRQRKSREAEQEAAKIVQISEQPRKFMLTICRGMRTD